MRRTIVVATTLAALLALAQPATAGRVDDCNQQRDADRRVDGCTALIRSGNYSGRELGYIFNNRGIAYFDLGEYALAIENYDQALRIDATDTDYYNNRGNAYANLDEYARAILDYDQAVRIDPGNAIAYNGRGAAYRHLYDRHNFAAFDA